ncbi:MAG: fumarylacetoacetate hydrolase family protein [Planctomycetes bacterium]|nr:fumarylacetoacetate hydrolase family protein [Planctomycetota bacterium]
MKLVAFATSSAPVRPGALLDADSVLDFAHPALAMPARAQANDAYDLAHPFLTAAREAVDKARDAATRERWRAAGAVLARSSVQLHAPVPRPGKILCIGLNYRDHAAEQNAELPKRPLLFSKFVTCVQRPDGPIRIPRFSTQTDFEAELGVVIGRRASRVGEAVAMQHVLGYCNLHDVSARDYQFGDGQWQRGKSCDTFAPFGPFVATTDEIPDPHRLRIQLRLNGKTMQDSNTNQLVFDVPQLIASISADITLEPGDVIATGTPPGVGCFRKPPVWLQPGDVCEVEIDGLGVLHNPVVAADTADAAN